MFLAEKMHKRVCFSTDFFSKRVQHSCIAEVRVAMEPDCKFWARGPAKIEKHSILDVFESSLFLKMEGSKV